MAEKLYGLTERSANQFRQMLADGGSVAGRASNGGAARGTTWVKVTSGTAVSGWYPAVVSLDVDGTFTDLAAAVKLKASDGSALTNGNRYLCTRTADDADGARFRTTPAPAGITGDYRTISGINFSITASDVWQDTGVTLSLPGAGKYLIQFWSSALAGVTAVAPGGSATIVTRFYDVTSGSAVPINGSTTCAVSSQVANQQAFENFMMSYVYTVTAAATLKVYASRFSGSTWGTSIIGNSGVDVTGVGYLKIG